MKTGKEAMLLGHTVENFLNCKICSARLKGLKEVTVYLDELQEYS